MKILIFILSLWICSAFGQVKFYRLDHSHSTMSIQGDSSLHEWQMKAEHIQVQASANASSNDSLTFKDLELKILIKELKSDKKSMDERAHTALKADEHPYIVFDFDEIISISRNKNSAQFVVRGQLSLAGETRTIDVSGDVKVVNENAFITGEHRIKMSDYNIDPPSMLFIKTRDRVKVFFNLKLVQKE